MFATDVPGYLQGFRFSDDSEFYDAAELRFRDLAGYDHRGNGLTITTGTPAFVTDATSGQRGLTLDNTVQGEFLFPIPWEGCAITAMKSNMTVNGSIYPVIIGGASAVTSNGRISLLRNGTSDYRHRMLTFGDVLKAEGFLGASQDTAVCAFSMSQETRKGYSTKDGVTVTESGPVTAATNGNGCAPGMAVYPLPDGFKARFGNLSGTLSDTSATTNTMTIFELHFFKGNPLVDNLAEVKAFMDMLKARYGVA